MRVFLITLCAFLAMSLSSAARPEHAQFVAWVLLNKSFTEICAVAPDSGVGLSFVEGVANPVYWPEAAYGPVPELADLPTVEEAAAVLSDRQPQLRLYRASFSKPQAQKTYENAFFDLIDELLVLVDDPQDPTPKLGFPELQALIAQVQATDPTTAINLSLNLLTIDAALKRYDTMWWDNAVRHEITPE